MFNKHHSSLCFTRPRYQVSVYRTTGPLVSQCEQHRLRMNKYPDVEYFKALIKLDSKSYGWLFQKLFYFTVNYRD